MNASRVKPVGDRIGMARHRSLKERALDLLAGVVFLLVWASLLSVVWALSSLALMLIIPIGPALLAGFILGLAASSVIIVVLSYFFPYFTRGSWVLKGYVPGAGAGAGIGGGNC
jgi:hypothetical protein